MDISAIDNKRLCHLPLVMDVFRRMKIDEVIDHAIPQDPRSEVSASECVATLLCGVYVGVHSLWRIRERMEPYDMPTIMRDETYDLQRFPEERLAKALDDLYAANLDKLMTGIAVQTVQHYAIDTSFLHFDTTSLTFYGGYEREDPFSGIEGMPAPPKVTYGFSKSNRGDLKQLMFGMLVSQDGGVPLLGKALDGNAADSVAAAEFFGRVRELVSDPREVCCVADSKGWTAENLSLIDAAGMRMLSRLPRNKSLHKKIMEARPPTKDVHELTLPPTRPTGDPRCYHYSGFDMNDIAEWTETGSDGLAIRRSKVIPVRVVRVFSEPLLKSKMKTLERQRERDSKSVEKAIRGYRRTVYACRQDAENAALRYSVSTEWPTLDLVCEIEHVSDPTAMRDRGRPPKYHNQKLARSSHWRINFSTRQASVSETKRRLREAATFILIRNHRDGWDICDEDMIRHYKRQHSVEQGFAWLKSGAEINPAFIETPHRIASLCFIYCIGLMIWNIIQRTVRKGLADMGEGLPYYRGKPSNRITTRFLFELFPGINSLALTDSEGNERRILSGLKDVHQLACRALGTSPGIFSPVVPRLRR